MTEAMFTLCGQVANVYVQPGGTSKKTGEAFDPRDKVQPGWTYTFATCPQRVNIASVI